MDLVSVIVPVYNVVSLLERCVNSLVVQEYDYLEIVLIDDGSKDDSGKLCDYLAQKYEKVVAYHKQNGGLGSARNYGVEKANGKYIAFVDSDDFVEKTYISDMYNLLTKYNADLASSLIVREDENGKKESSFAPIEDFELNKVDALLAFYSGRNCGWEACGKLFKKEHLIKHPFPVGLYEDVATTYLIIDECEKLAIGDYRNNYHYVVRSGSLLSTKFSEKNYRAFEICDEFSVFLSEKYPDFMFLETIMYKRFLVVMFNLCSIEKKTKKELFKKYKPKFKKEYKNIKKSGYASFKDLVYFKLLSTNLFTYNFVTKLIKLIK